MDDKKYSNPSSVKKMAGFWGTHWKQILLNFIRRPDVWGMFSVAWWEFALKQKN